MTVSGQGWLSVIAGYLLITFVNYWWHRARHRVPFLWRLLHRFHHSPTRVEVLGTCYKHPLEMVVHAALAGLGDHPSGNASAPSCSRPAPLQLF